MMNITSKSKDGTLIVYLEDEITINNTDQLNTFISDRINAGDKKVVINLQDVTYLDSSAVGTIVAAYSNLQSSGGALRLCSIKPEVLEILKAASLDTFLPIDNAEEESLLSI
jgi:anti-anti-sigma factor